MFKKIYEFAFQNDKNTKMKPKISLLDIVFIFILILLGLIPLFIFNF